MNATDSRNIDLAQASLEHAVYFMELGAADRAGAYLKFAIDHLQKVSEKVMLPSNILLTLQFRNDQFTRLLQSQ